MFKYLLVPLDGSRFSLRAVSYASDIAKRYNAEIIFLQVIKPVTPYPTTSAVPPSVESTITTEIAMKTALEEDKRNTTRAKRYLSNKVRGMKSQAIKASYQVVVGEPVQSIIDFSNKEQIDLIVMTTHGKSGLKRAIMGSVADAVIRESGKPVLVVRPQTSSKK